MMSRRSATQLIFATAFVALANQASAAEPAIIAKAGRGAGQVKVDDEEGVVVIDVTSPGGIGQITVQNGGQPWPMKAKLRLRYDAKRTFTHLEGCTVTDSKSRLQTFLGAEEVEVASLVGVLPRDAPKPDLKVEKANGTIEVTLPMNWIGDEKEFAIHWVDFYRG
jgi:hypothetical protein